MLCGIRAELDALITFLHDTTVALLVPQHLLFALARMKPGTGVGGYRMGARVCPEHRSRCSYQICTCWAADTDFAPQHWTSQNNPR